MPNFRLRKGKNGSTLKTMFQFKKKNLDDQLLKQRRLAEEEDAKRRASQLGLPYLDLISSKTPTEIEAMKLVKENDAKNALIAPIRLTQKKKLVLAAFDTRLPESATVINELKKKFNVEIFICSKTSLAYAWNYYQYITETKEIAGSVEINEEHIKEIWAKIKILSDLTESIRNFSSPYISQVLEVILAGGLAMKASDIHLEPGEKTNSFRLRIDGILHAAYSEFSITVYRSLITRIKLLSNLKLNIHDQAQDGRFTIKLKDRDIEVRTSVIPSEYGETTVLRLLDPTALEVNLEELGWRKDDLEIIRGILRMPNGLVLNTGPTGSGKTTTLYAFLRHVTKPEIKIITIEDPIEYHLQGISQTQVNLDSNYTFASGLRSILRQDPNIVLVGEIRDKETAEIALNASLTGHLVFSTLHTNDSVGAIPRLIDLGVKTQILGPSLRLVIAQRLVRVLCKKCKTAVKITEENNKKFKKFIEKLPARVNKEKYKTFSIFEPKGCEECGGLGYRGRISIFELFVVSEKIEALIYKNPTEIEIKDFAEKDGMVRMQEDGILKALQGITSLAEVERLTGAIDWESKRETVAAEDST